jgi:antitoxin component HigA of HigAB toxin-antitoxin module
MNKVEYTDAISELETLMDINPEVGTQKADRLLSLVSTVIRYEKLHFIFDVPNSVERERFRMEQMQ